MDSADTPVVIGAGIAGLLTALHLAPMRCLLLTNGRISDSKLCASSLAQGGIAAAVDAQDSPQDHARDTLSAGAGLSDPLVVERVCAQAPTVIEMLRRLGVNFDETESGELRLGLEGGHGARRIIHAADHTGAEIMRALSAAVSHAEHITVWENTSVTRINAPEGHVESLSIERERKHIEIPATRVVVATGGLGGLFRHTTNPPTARGQGIALAARAGARISDLEFVQFHPTALDVGGHQLPLVSEAVRGEGVPLVDRAGDPILDDALSTRDIVARAVWRATEEGRGAFLATPQCSTRFSQRFPTITAHCRAAGIDPDKEPIPVRVAAHYSMGGIEVDASGRASIGGLWACGEVARTGLHGANRLASNSLLEGAVFGARAADAAAADAAATGVAAADVVAADVAAAGTVLASAPSPTGWTRTQLQGLMWDRVGLLRTGAELEAAAAQLATWQPPGPETLTTITALEDRNLLDLARLLTAHALARPVSVGAHHRLDSPSEVLAC